MALLRQALPLVQYWREEGWIPAAESRNDEGRRVLVWRYYSRVEGEGVGA